MNENNSLKSWHKFLIIVISIIGYFGIFWTMNLQKMHLDINMNDNALEALKISVNSSRPYTCNNLTYYGFVNQDGLKKDLWITKGVVE